MIIGIAVVDKNWGIGKDNDLLFHIPEDMKFFREVTLNNIVCMGRKTLESLPNGEPLKNRTNVVLTSRDNIKNCICVHTILELLDFIKANNSDVFIIGGASLYKEMLPYYDKIYITKVFTEKEADAYFPNLDNMENFRIENCSNIINTNKYPIKFLTYSRIK